MVGQVLHLVMAVAMGVMAWPWGARLPTLGPMVFFLLAAVWFGAVGVSNAGAGHRVVNFYHTLMMLAMAWMYAVMSGGPLPGGRGATHHHPGPDTGSMPGMDMPAGGMDISGSGSPAWVSVLNWFWTIGFALAALCWLYRYFAERQGRAADPTHNQFGIAGQTLMAVGMAIMFAVML